ncbi:complex I subunit 5 family protein [Dethiobacter alkaliphilus]|uniref:complex I subunit 5 family protein n=1 Tax=Dethiobacter alkaliphilus TaxID=427926 RepID=UPI0022260825|nr:proton-conducting transporter membrane subunit [Dethiobacter alkaliphilus]MCW3489725.1 proton-conducting transporter membrane subunit [Dethiobacter alkaliphilus]
MSFTAAQEVQATTEVITSLLPVFAVAVPLAGSLLVFFAGRFSEKLRDICAVITALITFGIVFSMYPLVQQAVLQYEFAKFLQVSIHFRVDFFGFVFAALMSCIWFLATLYSIAYMEHGRAKNRYYVFLLSTLGHCLGVVLVGDLFSLFLFFELMTFSSYVLVIHEETPDAMAGGAVTLYLGVFGGLCLLMAIFLLYFNVGTMEIIPLYEQIAASAINPYTVVTLFLVGFGIKAGMVPLHIWLPKAHPVAPAPASALLSGLMIKAGAYGIFRVVGMIFTPSEFSEVAVPSIVSVNFGYAIIWMGIITMFLGAFMALLSTGAKKILAYSSVSQMGYILLGVGTAAYLGFAGPMGFAGALYHIINHAFFKAGLFMMVGSIYMITHNLDITQVRGMAKKVPFIAVTFLIGYAGIGGIPGFNGYGSKTILHHAIVDAANLHGSVPLHVAEKIFVVTSAMTLCYFAKLFRGLFLGDVPEKYDKKSYNFTWPVYAVLGTFGAIIIAIGLFPHFLLNRMVIPAMAGFTYDPYKVAYLENLSVWIWPDIREMVIVVVLAVLLFYVLNRFRLMEWRAPHWLSVEFAFYRPAYHFIVYTCCNFGTKFDATINKVYLKTGDVSNKMCSYVNMFDESINDAYEKSGTFARRVAEGTERFDSSINDAYEKTGSLARRMAEGTEKFDTSLNDAYEKSGSYARRMAEGTKRFDSSLNDAYEKSGEYAKKMAQKTAQFDDSLDDMYEKSGQRSRSFWDKLRGKPSDWNIKNLNFDSLLMAIMLVLFFLIIFYFSNITVL